MLRDQLYRAVRLAHAMWYVAFRRLDREALDYLRRYPQMITVDNGSEFTSKALDAL